MIANSEEIQRRIQEYAKEKGGLSVDFSIESLGSFSVILETKRKSYQIRNRRDFPWIDDVEEIVFIPFISFIDNGLIVDDLRQIKEVEIENKVYNVIRCEPHSEINQTYLYVVLGLKR